MEDSTDHNMLIRHDEQIRGLTGVITELSTAVKQLTGQVSNLSTELSMHYAWRRLFNIVMGWVVVVGLLGVIGFVIWAAVK